MKKGAGRASLFWDEMGTKLDPGDEMKINSNPVVKGGGWRTRFLGFLTCVSLCSLRSVGFDVPAWYQYQQETLDVGGAISPLTVLAPRWAAVFKDDPRWISWCQL